MAEKRTAALVPFEELASPVLSGSRMAEEAAYVQHGDTSTLSHSIAVAYYSLAFARAFRVRCDERSLVEGALLHDYFLYDWHDHETAPDSWHGFTHPRHALDNAERDFRLTEVERDLIVHHMFPLVPVPPRHREGAIVCLVDKACSLYEVFARDTYRRLAPFERVAGVKTGVRA